MNMPLHQLLQVFLAKLRFNMKSEASQTYLGYLWWVLEPALYLGVLFLVFGKFRGRGGPEFVSFLVTGILPFLWFSKSLTNSTLSIKSARGLINQIVIPKAIFPMLTIAQDLVKQLLVFGLMIVALLALDVAPTPSWLFVLLVALVQLLFISACALIVAPITLYLPDFRYIVGTGVTLLFFMSGVFFDYRQVILEKHQAFFLLNPTARLLKNYRQVLLENSPPDWLALGVLAGASSLVIFVMLRIYRHADPALTRAVI